MVSLTEVWVVEVGTMDESSTTLAASRHLAALSVVDSITAREFADFAQSLQKQSERDEADDVWHHRHANPEALIAFWTGEMEVLDTDDEGHATHVMWGNEISWFADLSLLPVRINP